MSQEHAPVAFHYAQTDSFVVLLRQLGASLLVSTYQANKLLAVRTSDLGLSTLVRTFDKPMGLAVDGSRLALGTRKEVWHLRNAPDIAPRIEPVGQHDSCWLPRSCHVTGDIGVHELAWASAASQQPTVQDTKRSYGSSARGFPASARWTPLTASCHAGGHRLSRRWRPRTAAT